MATATISDLFFLTVTSHKAVYTALGKFDVYRVRYDDDSSDDFHTITFANNYRDSSLEEFRLHDYEEGRGIFHRTVRSTFPVGRHGLIAASIPQSRKACVSPTSKGAPKTQLPMLGSDIIHFRVGPEPTTNFVIHEGMVAKRSRFIRYALTKEWKEAGDRTISLPDDDPEAFELYQGAVYTGLPYSQQPEDPAAAAKEYELFVKAYVLGDKLMDTDFKNAILDAIVRKLLATECFDARLSHLVYENMPIGSPSRRLWRDIYAWAGAPNWLEKSVVKADVHTELAFDLSKLQMSFWQGQRTREVPYIEDRTAYYELDVDV